MTCKCGRKDCGAKNKKTGKCFHQVAGMPNGPYTKMVCVHCGKKVVYCQRWSLAGFKMPYLRVKP